MQEKKNTFRSFLERSDALAEKMRVSLRELAPRMGLSVASLFGYRSGALPISTKAWGKLEAAEKAVGLGLVTRDESTSQGNHVHADEIESTRGNLVTRDEIPERMSALENQVARLTAALESQTAQLNALLEQRAATTREAQATSSPSQRGSRTSTSEKAAKKLA